MSKAAAAAIRGCRVNAIAPVAPATLAVLPEATGRLAQTRRRR